MRHDGTPFTSLQIREPEVEETVAGTEGTVAVRGMIPSSSFNQTSAPSGRFDYRRSFVIGSDRLTVETLVASSGQDKLSELVETIPVFLREMNKQRKQSPRQTLARRMERPSSYPRCLPKSHH